LLNPKQRGTFGEFQLESVLENIFAPNQWKAQYKFKNGEIVDAVVFLHDGYILPIDSKFSLENYNRMIECDNEQKAEYEKLVRGDLKGRIDETAKYIRPDEGTMDFAFMFIPSEALYYDMLIGKVGAGSGDARDLVEYAYRDKHVIIVSPTTFVAYLQTVLQGLRELQIEKDAKDIQKRVGKLGAHIHKFDELMSKVGNSLGTTVNHYNNAYTELGKIDKDVVKISDTSPGVDPQLLEKPISREE
jgi:DNA recombination protein RmuC